MNGWPVLSDPGAFRHSVSIEQLVQTGVTDEAGTATNWQTFLPNDGEEVLASIEPIRGSDIPKQGQTTTQLTVWVTLWFRPGILPNMRVVSPNGSKYLIQAVENVLEVDVILILYCLGLGANV